MRARTITWRLQLIGSRRHVRRSRRSRSAGRPGRPTRPASWLDGGAAITLSAVLTIRSESRPISRFVPSVRVIGRSVLSLSVRHGTPSTVVSSCTLPESVRTQPYRLLQRDEVEIPGHRVHRQLSRCPEKGLVEGESLVFRHYLTLEAAPAIGERVDRRAFVSRLAPVRMEDIDELPLPAEDLLR